MMYEYVNDLSVGDGGRAIIYYTSLTSSPNQFFHEIFISNMVCIHSGKFVT